MLELINSAVDGLTRDHPGMNSAVRPAGRGLPRAMSRILIGPAANVSIGVHRRPASVSDYQRWTQTLLSRGITPLWVTTGADTSRLTEADQVLTVYRAAISATSVTVTDDDRPRTVEDLLAERAGSAQVGADAMGSDS